MAIAALFELFGDGLTAGMAQRWCARRGQPLPTAGQVLRQAGRPAVLRTAAVSLLITASLLCQVVSQMCPLAGSNHELQVIAVCQTR
mmetsp:Transcript_53479/g.165528  ORF Transcript_53479/g.165528 Transcript_53479/m.165528 type:complete len:87 (+) Transcript_53479:1-261(+)